VNGSAPGKLVIISGPSGAGKSTVVGRLLAECDLPLQLSVSATTRQPRPGEVDGKDYHFLARDQFLARRDNQEFLEWQEVFDCGDYYGTLRRTVTAGVNAGKWVVLEIDVEGAMTVIESHQDAITIFLHPGSMAELERRLRERDTDSDDSIARRMEVARHEMTFKERYKFDVQNNTVDQAVADVCSILKAQLSATTMESPRKSTQ
jgi:guanylate kinase